MEIILVIAIAWALGICIMNREAKHNKPPVAPEDQAVFLRREEWWRLNGYDKNFKKK